MSRHNKETWKEKKNGYLKTFFIWAFAFSFTIGIWFLLTSVADWQGRL